MSASYFQSFMIFSVITAFREKIIIWQEMFSAACSGISISCFFWVICLIPFLALYSFVSEE